MIRFKSTRYIHSEFWKSPFWVQVKEERELPKISNPCYIKVCELKLGLSFKTKSELNPYMVKSWIDGLRFYRLERKSQPYFLAIDLRTDDQELTIFQFVDCRCCLATMRLVYVPLPSSYSHMNIMNGSGPIMGVWFSNWFLRWSQFYDSWWIDIVSWSLDHTSTNDLCIRRWMLTVEFSCLSQQRRRIAGKPLWFKVYTLPLYGTGLFSINGPRLVSINGAGYWKWL